MVQEFVYGVYQSLDEAEAVVDELTGKGVSRSGIRLLANEDVIQHANSVTPIESIEELAETRSHWWEGLLDFFTFDTSAANDPEAERKIDFTGYRENIEAGEILILVDGAFEDTAYRMKLPIQTENTVEPSTADDITETDYHEMDKISDSPIDEQPESLASSLYNPFSGANMADEPGVNIEEFADDHKIQPPRDSLSEVDETIDDQTLQGNASTYGDPTIHQEVVERQTKNFNNLRHPREGVTEEDVDRAFDEVRHPK